MGLNPGLPDHWRTLNSLGQWLGDSVLGKKISGFKKCLSNKKKNLIGMLQTVRQTLKKVKELKKHEKKKKKKKTDVILFTNPSARAGYDTKSIFKRSLTDLISEFSFS